MSAPLKLTVAQLNRLSCFMQALTQARRDHDVRVDAFGPVTLTLDGMSLEASWDQELDEYAIDDRIGS